MTSFYVRHKPTLSDSTIKAVSDATNCRICHGFTQKSLIQLHELAESQRTCAGCYFLQGVLIVLIRSGHDVPLDSSTPLLLTSWSLWGTENFLTIARCKLEEFLHWQAPTILDDARHFEIFALPEDKCPWPKVPIRRLISGDTSSAACIGRLRKYLEQCMRQHHLCGPNKSVELPTRVLEISSIEDGKLEVHLKVTNGEIGRYVCLSHRWIEGEILTTTTTTMSARIAGIPWNELPKAYQEAILVAHKLDFCHIWIDSLAILQDEASGDWLKEAPKMAQYYHNSSLTISVAEASPSLFHRSPDQAQIVWNVEPPERFHQPGYSVRMREPLSHDTSPLHQRGWVYQEHVLSRRIAHFGKELIWECMEVTSCECGKFPLPTDNGKSPLPDPWDVSNLVNAYGRKGSHALSLISDKERSGYWLVPKPVYIEPSPDSTPGHLRISHWLIDQRYVETENEALAYHPKHLAEPQKDTKSEEVEHQSTDLIPLQTGGVYREKSQKTPKGSSPTGNEDSTQSKMGSLTSQAKRLGENKLCDQKDDIDNKFYKTSIDPFVIKLAHCRWLDIIAQYSRRSLTYRSDIFPALAGLAKQYQPHNGEYCAGLWKDMLATGLLWRACNPKEHPKPSDWRSPSWSWAATTSPVDYYHLLVAFELTSHTFRYSITQTFITDPEFECEPLHGHDTTMSLKSAKLTLSGPLFELVYGPILDKPEKDDDPMANMTAEEIEAMRGQMETTIRLPSPQVAESDIRYFPLARHMDRHQETSWLASSTGFSFALKRDKKKESCQPLDIWWDNKEAVAGEALAPGEQTFFDCLLVAQHVSEMDAAYYALLLEKTSIPQTYRRRGLVRFLQGAALDTNRVSRISLI